VHCCNTVLAPEVRSISEQLMHCVPLKMESSAQEQLPLALLKVIVSFLQLHNV